MPSDMETDKATEAALAEMVNSTEGFRSSSFILLSWLGIFLKNQIEVKYENSTTMLFLHDINLNKISYTTTLKYYFI